MFSYFNRLYTWMKADRFKPYLLLLPVLSILAAVFVNGLITGFLQSIGYFPALGLREITPKYYVEIFRNPAFLSALVFSLYTALVSAILATVLGLLLALCLLRSNSQDRISHLVYRLPIIVPHTVAALLVISLLGQSGMLARIAISIGLIEKMSDFPVVTFDRGGIGLMVAYMWKEIPFVALVVYGVLRSVDEKYNQVARNLGANGFQLFKEVLLPMALPALSSAFIIIFSFSFGAFEIPYLLGPTSPRALPVLAYIAFTHPDLLRRPYAMAMNMVIALITLVMVILYRKSYELLDRLVGKQEVSG